MIIFLTIWQIVQYVLRPQRNDELVLTRAYKYAHLFREKSPSQKEELHYLSSLNLYEKYANALLIFFIQNHLSI